jgi:hypothetical protein
MKGRDHLEGLGGVILKYKSVKEGKKVWSEFFGSR